MALISSRSGQHREWFRDLSRNNFTVTNFGTTASDEGSGKLTASFNGTTNYFTVPHSTSLDLSGDFTVEAFVKLSTRGTQDAFLVNGRGAVGSSTAQCAWALRQDTTYGLSFYRNVSTLQDLRYSFPSPVLGDSVWRHVAASRVGTTLYLFMDGSLVATHLNATTTFTKPNTDVMQIGRGNFQTSTSYYYINGKITGIRVVNGTGLYTSNFTPALPTLVNNTVLLINFGATARPV